MPAVAFYISGHGFGHASRQIEIAKALARVWKAQRFSWWMTQIFHLFPDEVPFDRRRQLAELDYIAHSTAAQTSLAEQYTGLPIA